MKTFTTLKWVWEYCDEMKTHVEWANSRWELTLGTWEIIFLKETTDGNDNNDLSNS